ncbi:MAG TPA: beta-galactosidase [Longimicrobium sp.]|nr:beta-galactosidase [Longimicrobium sp.]
MSPKPHTWRFLAVLLALGVHAGGASGQEMVIDATEAPPPVETGFLRLGSNRSPEGHVIGATSRYLTRDGEPWVPVMGEFHFSRYPEQYWEEEILKMKAAGVQIVASYVIWIHHEEEEGRFDWSGQRDLRRFVELVGKHGMYAYPRIGPWSHAEVRNGGLPDWLVRRVGTNIRSNDPVYLGRVDRFYQQIGQQLRGLLWKDGGPVIGIQLENEYNARGPLRGEEHILELKRMARRVGLDVPLYTVTGWDNTVLPPAEVIPVFGGYPDMPWDASIQQLPPGEVYAFRFENRWAGNMGAQGPAQQLNPTSHQALARYPFLGAEYGAGIQNTYHRRPVIGADDAAAMLPVQVGSGNNLYGYYMFHGGTNPVGRRTTLQESQRTGYPTDVPVRSYDFQAPLSEFGEMRASYRKTRLVHHFLNEFGDELAPMVPRRPSAVPANPADTTVFRVSARTLGDRGFIFFNNQLRDYPLPPREDVQVTLNLLGEKVRVPERPIDIPSGAYGIWPVNLRMDGTTLTYSTAQLLTRVSMEGGPPVWVFFAIPGIAPEFVFESSGVGSLDAPDATVSRLGSRIYVRNVPTGPGPVIVSRAGRGEIIRIVLLSQEQAENLTVTTAGGLRRLLISPQDVFVDEDRIHLRSRGGSGFSLAVYPDFSRAPEGLTAEGRDGIFTRYTAARPPRPATVSVSQAREADAAPPVTLYNAVTWRTVEIALVPSDSAWEGAGRWRIEVPPDALEGLSDLFLEIRYTGDQARLYAGGELLTDNFFNGLPWRVGLKRYADALRRGPLELQILPLRADAPVFIPASLRPTDFGAGGQRAEVQAVEAIPEYELIVPVPPGRR